MVLLLDTEKKIGLLGIFFLTLEGRGFNAPFKNQIKLLYTNPSLKQIIGN